MGKVVITIPPGLRQAIENNDPEKPYDICLNCAFFQESCDGPNILSMEYPRWIEWANSRAKQIHLTRAQIAERANLPKSTLDSILSGRTQDIRASTMRAITKVLVGGCWGQYPCHLAALLINSEELRVDEQIADLQRQLEEEKSKSAELRSQLSNYHDIHQRELSAVREEAQEKTEWLKGRCKVMDNYISDQKKMVAARDKTIEQKDKIIGVLCVLVALLGAIIIGALLYDKAHPDTGWFQTSLADYSISNASSSL